MPNARIAENKKATLADGQFQRLISRTQFQNPIPWTLVDRSRRGPRRAPVLRVLGWRCPRLRLWNGRIFRTLT